MHVVAATASMAIRILDTAQLMVQQRGFHAFSYRDIADEIGIKSASIHYHFPTKPDLARAILDRIIVAFDACLKELDLLTDTREKLRRFCAIFLDTFQGGDRLCAFCMVATAQDGLPAAVRARVTDFWQTGELWLEGVLEEGRKNGRLAFSTNPQTVARLFIVGLEGGMVTARAFEDRARFIAIADHLVASVVPPEAKPESLNTVQPGGWARLSAGDSTSGQ